MLYKYYVTENKTEWLKTEVLCKTKTIGQCVSVCYVDIKVVGSEIYFWKVLDGEEHHRIELRKIDINGDTDEVVVKSFQEKRSDKKYNLVAAVINKHFV
jgi:hypothetical protein